MVLEKETELASHQTGRNSGVIHSGLYYRPGSRKARWAVEGAERLKGFCADRGIAFDVPGKLVVAPTAREVDALDRLLHRGRQNGVPVRRAGADEIAAREPQLRAYAGLVVDSTGRVRYGDVAAAFAADLRARGGEIRTGIRVQQVRSTRGETRVETDQGTVLADRVAVCGGLHADRLARASGLDPGVRILPFRGEYSELLPDRAWLVRGLVYPVPNPELPFLGVHLTRGIDGIVHLGPNAVPALAREGYSWGTVSPRDVFDMATFPGSWKLARAYGRIGMTEMVRSLTGRSLVRAGRTLVPALRLTDITRSRSGVRAQAVHRDGSLVDDFLFLRHGPVLHVLNVPSPAATACLAIGEHIAHRLYS